jgi:glycosyltransferase involved in cell wall biosynthesis
VIEGSRVVVVVPAFDEEAHVGRVVATLPAFVDLAIVIDDGSSDRTSEVARAAGATVLRHPARRGVGAAIATGYAEGLARTMADRDVLAVMAGDGQMHPDDLEDVVRPVAGGEADYVKGDRFGFAGVRAAMGLPRWVGGRVFSGLTSLAVGQRIRDSQCGFTALARGAACRLDLAALWPSFGYPNDLLGLCATKGMRIREVPVRPIYGAETSKLRLRHLPPIFFLIARAAVRRASRPRVAPSDDSDTTGADADSAVS